MKSTVEDISYGLVGVVPETIGVAPLDLAPSIINFMYLLRQMSAKFIGNEYMRVILTNGQVYTIFSVPSSKRVTTSDLSPVPYRGSRLEVAGVPPSLCPNSITTSALNPFKVSGGWACFGSLF